MKQRSGSGSSWVRLAIAVVTLSTLAPSVSAASFGQQEIDPSQVIAIASPVDEGAAYQLLVLEQVNNQRQCWQRRSDGTDTVEPLLLGFDFTGICGRATDSNGYSVRLAGEDLGWRYSLRVIQRDGYLVLVGVPVDQANYPTLEIGQTREVTNDFSAIELNPGWRLTKRTFGDRALGHFYLTNDTSLESLAAAGSGTGIIGAPAAIPPAPTGDDGASTGDDGVPPVPVPPAAVPRPLPPLEVETTLEAEPPVVVETRETNGDRELEFGIPPAAPRFPTAEPSPPPTSLPTNSNNDVVVPILPPPPPSPLL